jgi:hypothetical protein
MIRTITHDELPGTIIEVTEIEVQPSRKIFAVCTITTSERILDALGTALSSLEGLKFLKWKGTQCRMVVVGPNQEPEEHLARLFDQVMTSVADILPRTARAGGKTEKAPITTDRGHHRPAFRRVPKGLRRLDVGSAGRHVAACVPSGDRIQY